MPYHPLTSYTDPCGPGTTAWVQFDLAVLAAQERKRVPYGEKRLWTKKYHNHRGQMLAALREHGEDEKAWLLDLATAIAAPLEDYL